MVLFFRFTRKRFKKCSRFCRRHYYYALLFVRRYKNAKKATRRRRCRCCCCRRRRVCSHVKREVVFVSFFTNCRHFLMMQNRDKRREKKTKDAKISNPTTKEKNFLASRKKSRNFLLSRTFSIYLL